MIARRFISQQTSEVIQEICVLQADAEEKLLTHFVPPVGVPELVFYIGGRRQIRNIDIEDGFIKGQYDIPQKIDFNPGYFFLAIRLKPYGLRQLFNISANKLRNAVIDAKEHELTAKISSMLRGCNELETNIVGKIFQIVEGYPRQSISDSTKTFLQLIEENSGNKISGIIKDSGIGIRTLQRNFLSEVGLTPKKFLRIERMNKIEKELHGNKGWIEFVADFDFTDQSHFIREFRSLRRYNPNDLVAKKLLLSDQLPVPEEIFL